MTQISSQEYAGLSAHSYRDVDVGRRGPVAPEVVDIEGAKYKILEHVNNARTGYQGTIYQRLEGGDIVVAHRGTEQIWKDGVVADGSMVTRRTNPQAQDAIALTERARQYASDIGQQPGMKTPEVTVTGHSLGGTLAQITAHHYNLRGETFNAYGAGSLNLKIPEGPNGKVINHVMANDAVSAASPHYGEVRTYATEREISVLHWSGYQDNRILDAVTPDLAVVAAGRSFGSHAIKNFVTEDEHGNPTKSILQDPQAQPRAKEHERIIENYRSDVQGLRRAVTIGARGPIGWVRDVADHYGERDPAGAPGAREQLQRDGENRRFQDASPTRSLGDNTGVEKGAPGQRAEGASQSDMVKRLLEGARDGNTESIRAATEGLAQTQSGQAWQARADSQAQQLSANEHAQEQALKQSAQQDAARYG